MQTFGFSKKRPEVGNGPGRIPNGHHSAVLASHSDDEPPASGSYPLTPEPLRSSYEASPTGTRSGPPSASLNRMHPQSTFLNTSDPVAMHLLMETAMIDSKSYEILSYEEVEELKRDRVTLQNRGEAIRRKLALELKLKDAAQSLNRLYSTKGRRDSDERAADGSPKSPKKTRRSLLGNRQSSSDVLNRTDDEFAASNRKCDELKEELCAVEKRQQEVARRILQHTAGILQMTHRGLKKNIRRDNLPRSPESIAGFDQQSPSLLGRLHNFDDRSLYKSPDQSEHYSGNSTAGLQILEQTEQQLDLMNHHIHELVLQADPKQDLKPPPQNANSGKRPQYGLQVKAQVEYLRQAMEAMGAAQAKTMISAQRSVDNSEDQLGDVNARLHDLLKKTNTGNQSPVGSAPDSRGKSLESQLSVSDVVLDRLNQRVEHLVEQKRILSRQIQQQRNLNSKSDSERDTQITNLTKELSDMQDREAQLEEEAQDSSDQIHLLMEQLDSARQEAVLVDQKRTSEDKKALQAEKNARNRADSSLKKLQEASQADRDAKNRAEDHHKKLQGSLQNERAAKKKADESLKQLKSSLQTETRSREQAEDALAKLQSTLEAGSDAQKQISENIGQLQASVQAEREGKQQAEQQVAQLQESLQQERDSQRHADGTLTQLQGTLQAERETARDLEDQLTQAQDDLDEAKIDKAQAEADVEKCRKEIEDLEGAVVRTQTDLTVVRAELDGAYGTRAQRAADVTMNPAIRKEMDELNDKNKSLHMEIEELQTKGSGHTELEKKIEVLQKELADTIEEYAQMTKASMEFEKDREQLEASVDSLRERCESLEAQLSDEKVKWLGMKSPGLNGLGSPGGSTSTMVLKNEFKKMMRDTRAENLKALRAEQDERRKLEGLVRSLKTEQQQQQQSSPRAVGGVKANDST